MGCCLSKNKKSYHLISNEEMDKITKATHHEEISMVIKKKSSIDLHDFLKLKKEKCLLLALDEVSNPHNIGAILRTAAHFGIDGVIINSKKVAETASAIRVAEGGTEYVHVFESENMKDTLTLLSKNKFQIVTTSSHAKQSLDQLKWNKFAVIVFGEEGNGLSKEIMNSFNCIKIPGTDHVESLNVSVASSILMYDYFRNLK